MGGAFGRIARLLRRPAPEPGDPVPDAELLGRFVRSADQSAFELLVWRHAVMVFGVCRRIVRDEHLAEDAFQATFLVLARKAGSVRGSNLAGWLFRVARRVAVRARTQAAARAKRETPLAAEPPAPPAQTDELFTILDEEIARLPERFRLPVVLCYLGGRSTEDAARLLGCPRGTVLSRLATARGRLVAHLTRRGVTVPAMLFTVAAVPSGLGAVAPLVAPAVRLAVGRSAGGAPGAVALAQGVITAMSIAKTITAAGAFVVAVGLVWGFGLVAADGPAPETAQKAKTQTTQPPEKAKPPAEAPPTADDPAKAREDHIRRLEKLADQFKRDITARERAIRTLAENNSMVANAARVDRVQKAIAKLDDEIFATEKELVELDVEAAVLRGRLDAKFRELISRDPRIVENMKQRNEKQVRYDEEKRLIKGESPTTIQLGTEIARLDRERDKIRKAVEADLLASGKGFPASADPRLVATLDKQDMLREVLERRKKYRDNLEQSQTAQARDALDIKRLLAELEPQREYLHKIETRLLELRVEHELGPVLTWDSSAVEAKLDRLIREVEELRREVRELRKQE